MARSVFSTPNSGMHQTLVQQVSERRVHNNTKCYHSPLWLADVGSVKHCDPTLTTGGKVGGSGHNVELLGALV